MRLFIAINFAEKVKDNLVKIQDDLRNSSKRGNFSRRENLHLTLVFLGEVPNSKVGTIKTVMDSIKVEPFTIQFENGGKFGSTHWVGIKRCDPLLSLQKNLADGLRKAGFAIEKRPYKPHITIAREVSLIQNFSYNFKPFSTNADAFVLMKSERIDGKLTYTEVYKKTLQ